MPEDDVHAKHAEAVFRGKFHQKLAAHGYRGAELDCRVEELMGAPVSFRLDLGEDPPA
jgi:hypothetical protein